MTELLSLYFCARSVFNFCFNHLRQWKWLIFNYWQLWWLCELGFEPSDIHYAPSWSQKKNCCTQQRCHHWLQERKSEVFQIYRCCQICKNHFPWLIGSLYLRWTSFPSPNLCLNLSPIFKTFPSQKNKLPTYTMGHIYGACTCENLEYGHTV